MKVCNLALCTSVLAIPVLLMPPCVTASPKPHSLSSVRRTPLSFERNVGQTDRRVKFLSRGNGYSLFLTPKEAVFSLQAKQQRQGAVLRMQLVGANPHASETTQSKLSRTTNYFVGKDRGKWRTGVENFGRVGFSEVYKGVDVVYYGNQSQLEYDFLIKPKAKPSEIRLKFAGAKRVKALPSGELLLEAGNGSLKWHAPIAYQEANGKRKSVQAKYQISKSREVCFAVGEYDTSKPLVIDPALTYSTYLGGNDYDWANCVAVDSSGSLYIAGQSYGTDFPTTIGAFQTQNTGGSSDAFVTKLSANGDRVIYSTYLGGKDYDWANGVAVDSKGCAYVAGVTSSTDFPITKSAFQKVNKGSADAFVTKLSADGKSLVYSTYLGGKQDYDWANGIAVDSKGSAYIAGRTYSTDFPITKNAFQTQIQGDNSDAFVTKLSADGKSLVYSTYLGGETFDWASAITVDSKGYAYVPGYTNSYTFPTTTGAFQPQNAGGGTDGYDAFVTKLSADGKSLVYSTYLGGSSDYEYAYAIAVDSKGSAYVTGRTFSNDFPTTAGSFQPQSAGGGYTDSDGNFFSYGHAFITKLSPDAGSLVYSTYLSGTHYDYAYAIAIDGRGCAYVAGNTGSLDFPVTSGAFQTEFKGGDNFDGDGFLTKLSADGSTLFYSTYLGGSSHDYVSAISVDSKGSAYLAGVTTSTDFPTKSAIQKQNRGERDAFIAKFDLPRSLLLLPASSLVAGESTTGTVILDSVATSDTRVSLASDSTLVSLPSSVVVPKGAKSVSFDLSTSTSLYDTEVHLTTTPTTKLAYTRLLLLARRTLTSLKSPNAILTQGDALGTVSLDIPAPDAGIVVTLTSDNSALTVPNSVTISKFRQSEDFTISAGNVSADTKATLTATYDSVTLKQEIELQAPRALTRLQVPPTLATGSGGIGTLTLDMPAPSTGIAVRLTTDSSALKIPKSVTVPASKSSVDFSLLAGSVSSDTLVTVSAIYQGVTLKKKVKIQAAAVVSVALTPSTIKGGNSVKGTVSIIGTVPTEGLVVNLNSTKSDAQVPQTVTIPAGKTSADFTITTSKVLAQTKTYIKAKYGVSLAQSTLTILP